MLKAIVDETSHGKYDFMYLRIGKLTFPGQTCRYETTNLHAMPTDFANNCKYGCQPMNRRQCQYLIMSLPASGMPL